MYKITFITIRIKNETSFFKFYLPLNLNFEKKLIE